MRFLLALSLFAGACTTASGRGPDDPALQAIRAFEFKRGRYNVPPYDGQLLHDLIVRHKARRILELGTSNGYSALWMGWAAKKVGGKVWTIEIDEGRWREAVLNLRKARLDDVVEAHLGDAFRVIQRIPGDFDLVFMDVWKPDYVRFFQLLKPRLRKGGVFTAHNVCQRMKGIAEFLAAAKADPDFETHVDCKSGAGVSVSVRR